MAIATRKAEHLTIAAEPGVTHLSGTGLEDLRLRHRALPGRDLADVTLTTPLLGARLAAPILVSAMTGGTEGALAVNAELARAAAEHGVAMVLGSGRPLLDDPSLLRRGFPGVIGLKTGYTDEAGRCLVAAARRNGVRLAAIVLNSPDPATQTRQLLQRGFRATT